MWLSVDVRHNLCIHFNSFVVQDLCVFRDYPRQSSQYAKRKIRVYVQCLFNIFSPLSPFLCHFLFVHYSNINIAEMHLAKKIDLQQSIVTNSRLFFAVSSHSIIKFMQTSVGKKIIFWRCFFSSPLAVCDSDVSSWFYNLESGSNIAIAQSWNSHEDLHIFDICLKLSHVRTKKVFWSRFTGHKHHHHHIEDDRMTQLIKVRWKHTHFSHFVHFIAHSLSRVNEKLCKLFIANSKQQTRELFFFSFDKTILIIKERRQKKLKITLKMQRRHCMRIKWIKKLRYLVDASAQTDQESSPRQLFFSFIIETRRCSNVAGSWGS